MKFQTYLIKYGEIGIKGKNRYMFEDALVRQIRHSLKTWMDYSILIKHREEFMWTVTEIMTEMKW